MVTGQELTDRLLEQIKPFNAEFHFNQMVDRACAKLDDGRFELTTDGGIVFACQGGGDRGRRRFVPAEEAADPRHRSL